MVDSTSRAAATRPVRLRAIAREWGRIGCLGFGGPPAHITMLRDLCVRRRGWIDEADFEDRIAATNLLPGPASTQFAIYTAWRLRGTAGALVGGCCFIAPGLALILVLAAVFLAADSPGWVRGAAAGAGAAVAAVAVHAATGVIPASWARAGDGRAARARWMAYAAVGVASSAVLGPWLVAVLIGAGLLEVALRSGSARGELGPGGSGRGRVTAWPVAAGTAMATGGLGALAWVAFKVGALSYGGGFVIIPLMQADAVDRYGWMSGAQFLNAVALGQITPGPVVQTVAVVGYAAAGLPGGLLAAAVAFAPSFAFVLAGGRHFDRLRADPRVQAFFTGAGPAVIGAIAGSAIPLAHALHHLWQFGVLAAAALWLLAARRGVVSTLLGAGLLGVLAVAAGWPAG
ncbi:chromate efflux transporter [Nocardia seriolae]|uniref:Chromate transport protein n=3 Tax=Nocardia seriolae TaxID=37332 RepID=A0ABC9YPR4_9NOCA|nr:chromate efflux transporter [Nocardia seriolae]APB00096.1 Chromate transport protein [Nocardia seriolae]MTJ64769.1 chromate efflux transporter [Nocardia seriolae]MTJ72567.1 chromate efflux transporter [Nocardia seriolae]MTJ89608.1 chromate efflux transporter [Nocardia seriolae]MTK50175.1 chromate efflux transporter [Nocardia seriolae]